jgi:hypothetical protein
MARENQPIGSDSSICIRK